MNVDNLKIYMTKPTDTNTSPHRRRLNRLIKFHNGDNLSGYLEKKNDGEYCIAIQVVTAHLCGVNMNTPIAIPASSVSICNG